MRAELKGSFCPAPFVRDALFEHLLHLAQCFGRESIPGLGYDFPQHGMRSISLVSIHASQSRRKLVVENEK